MYLKSGHPLRAATFIVLKGHPGTSGPVTGNAGYIYSGLESEMQSFSPGKKSERSAKDCQCILSVQFPELTEFTPGHCTVGN